MHIFKNQILQYENVLSYRTRIQISDVNKMIGFIQRNTDALNLKICGNIAATVHEKIYIRHRGVGYRISHTSE